jgi:transmembrane sensor
LDAWLAADPRRLGAFAKARAVMVYADRARILEPGYIGAEPYPFDGVERLMRRRGPTRRWALMGASAMAAGVATAAAGIGFAVWTSVQRYQTERGEVRRLPLADGSVVTLNTATKLEVKFSGASRNIQLVQGEALFDVAKNPRRPFYVDAGDVRVRAVGTSFTVAKLPGRPTEILVREGVVEITRPGAVGAVRLGANERALVRADEQITSSAMEPGSIARKLAWRQGMISFEGTSLSEAAAEFARYADPQIVVDDPSIANQTISGMFSAENPQGFAKAVAVSLNLSAQTEGGKIYLSR